MCTGTSYLVDLEEEEDGAGQVGVEAGHEYAADLIEATKAQVGKLKSNGSDQQVLSDALKKIDWVHEHLKTRKKSKKYKEIFHRALGVIKSLYKKLQKEKEKDYFESNRIIEHLIYASRGEAEIKAPPLVEENKTRGTQNVPMLSSSSQEPPNIHTEVPSKTTESPSHTRELSGFSVTESVESVNEKCEPVTAMAGCNARCTKGKIRCQGKLKNSDFQENLQYFSSEKLSDSKYVSILSTPISYNSRIPLIFGMMSWCGSFGVWCRIFGTICYLEQLSITMMIKTFIQSTNWKLPAGEVGEHCSLVCPGEHNTSFSVHCRKHNGEHSADDDIFCEDRFGRTYHTSGYGERHERPKWTGLGRIGRACRAYDKEDKNMWFRSKKIVLA